METLLPTSKANIVGAARPLPPVTLDTSMAGIKERMPARLIAPRVSSLRNFPAWA